jgi:hypothetical protein
LTRFRGDSAEEALRLAIASHYSDRAKQLWRKLIDAGKLPWAELAGLATNHGLGPLLYAAVETNAPVELPIQVRAELKRQYQLTATLNMLAMHDLEEILLCLNDTGIQTVLLKGAALLNDIYGNQALRPMVDLDILISFADLPLALESLTGIGYENPEPSPFVNVGGIYWNEVLLRDTGRTSAQLEVHWNLLDNPYYAPRLEVPSLIQRAIPAKVGTQHALVLSPEDLLLHICAHNLYHHRGMLWRTDVDIAFVAHRYGQTISWDRLISSAVADDMVLGVKQSLIKAADFWLAPIPQTVLEQIGELDPVPRERFWAVCQRSEFLKLLRTFVALPSAGHRWHFMRGQLLPSREYLAWRYGTPLSTPAPLAYARRYLSGLSGLMAEISGRALDK